MRSLIFGIFFLTILSTPDAIAKNRKLEFKKGSLHAYVSWIKGPMLRKESEMLVYFTDAKTNLPVELKDEFNVVLWMPSMGHGSAPTKIEKVYDQKKRRMTGVYRVKKIFFSMGGKWDVNLTLKTTNEKIETKTVKVEL